MTKLSKTFLAISLMAGLCGCSAKKNESSPSPTVNQSTESWFEWDGTTITEVKSEYWEEEELIIPKKCTDFAKDALLCVEAKVIRFENPNTNIGRSIYDGNFVEVYLPENLKEIPDEAMWLCDSIEKVVIPDSVEKIGTSAFDGCENLKDVVFGNSVKDIGHYAFAECSSLSEIVLPDSVENIGSGAFEYCTSLESFTLPKNIRTMGGQVFDMSGLKEVYVPEEVDLSECRPDAFEGTDDLTVFVVEGAWADSHFDDIFDNDYVSAEKKYYGETSEKTDSKEKEDKEEKPSSAAGNSTISDSETLYIPEGRTTVKAHEYTYEDFRKIVIPDSVEKIETSAFASNKNLEEIVFGKGLKEIGSFAFSRCESLKDVRLPEGLEILSGDAFDSCTSLETVYLPESLNEVYLGVFDNCDNLKDIYVAENMQPEYYFMNTFETGSSTPDVHVVAGSWVDQNFDDVFCGTNVHVNKVVE